MFGIRLSALDIFALSTFNLLFPTLTIAVALVLSIDNRIPDVFMSLIDTVSPIWKSVIELRIGISGGFRSFIRSDIFDNSSFF